MMNPETRNSLEDFFDKNTHGPGIWKWRHYFEIYDRHFHAFRGSETHFLEIGVYSGGSLAMWEQYLGPAGHVYGVDREPSCKRYETTRTKIFIGDQTDRVFWKHFREAVPLLDIIVDDGGHLPIQQRTSLEELLPHLRPGGVYLCEDITGMDNEFASYAYELTNKLNAFENVIGNIDDNERRLVLENSEFQSVIHSIHFYPFVIVIEKRPAPLQEMVAPKHGTIWEPFLT